ncbi:MAG: nucleotidyltransferase family protein [Elainellaceae cyanobacterium]
MKQEYGATRVMVFGSLSHRQWFSLSSDVDLAVWGLSQDDYLIAIACLQYVSPEFKVDLVAMERCRPELAKTILSEGNEL